MFTLLSRRELTGKKLKINGFLPLRTTSKQCLFCKKPIHGIIIDIFEDMDVWKFRYHYFIPWNICHKCRPPLSI